MNQTYTIFISLCVLVFSFIGGLILFEKSTAEQQQWIIHLLDARVLLVEQPTFLETIFPHLMIAIVFFLFYQHPLLRKLILVICAFKITFYGFCSSYLLQTQTSTFPYVFWWFPFQLVYCVLLLALANRINLFTLSLYSIIIIIEYFLIPFVLYNN
ncbi:hypothetical protein PB01_07300 [Psychrobacillus glaciei]|uniref:Uncharacterized protein n=1 Tax=Psychrobacillus glaciei TaxID=2283160 RepID=A0A5J6SPH6_9BACI|nr:hypothetical protein [Psychrobacillus glaciei]QFF98654.1 hypothetical protein PB01_07300 [Psychrobacillus glaciei]